MGRCGEGMAWFWPVPLGKCSASLPEVRSLEGGVAWWVMPGNVRFSVPGAWRGQLWAGAQNRKEKKKVKRCNSGPGLAQACAAQPRPSMRRPAVHGSRVAPPACAARGIQSPAAAPATCATYLRSIFPKFQNPKTTRSGSCLHVPALALLLLVTVTDRACLALTVTHPPPPPSLPSRSSSFLRLNPPLASATYFFSRLSSVILLNLLTILVVLLCQFLLQQHRISQFSSLVITNSHRSIS